MKLVKINDYYYLNMDFIVKVWFDGNNYHVSDVSTSEIPISKETYNTILSYGKATI